MGASATREVRFFVHEAVGETPLLRCACALIDEAWQQSSKVTVLVRVDNEHQAGRLDELLWTYRDDAFIPHERAPDDGSPATPVVIAEAARPLPATTPDLFIDATASTPAGDLADTVARVAVILDADPARRAAGRDRYREWRALGITPVTIQPDVR